MSKANLFKRGMAALLVLAMIFAFLPVIPFTIHAEEETAASQSATHVSNEIIDSADNGVSYAGKGLGKKGYVVFTGVNAAASASNIEDTTVTVDSNLYAENAVLSGFGRVNYNANWITDADGQYLNAQDGVSAPIDKWSIISRDILTGTGVTNGLSGSGVQFTANDGNVRPKPASLVLSKTSEEDISVTIYAYMLKASGASSFSNSNATVSVYKRERTDISYGDADATELPAYGELLATTTALTNGVGAFVTFTLSGVGQFEIVLHNTAGTAHRPAIGGFWMDAVPEDDGEEVYHTYSIEDGKVVDEDGTEVSDMTESGILNMNGKSATIASIAEGVTLTVVDTSLIPENGADLTGTNAGKLTVNSGAERI